VPFHALSAEAPRVWLTNQNGRWFLDIDLRGGLVLYNFTYTRCAAPCPQTSVVMRAVQDRLCAAGSSAVNIALVTVWFDPERDTPAVLRVYAARQGADPSRWRIATSELGELKQMIGRGFKTYYSPSPIGTFGFDPVFVLVDADGVIRAEYRTAAPNIDRIFRDIGLVQDEARNSQGAGRLAYEAAQLFVCYAR
jgi:protein SCO1